MKRLYTSIILYLYLVICALMTHGQITPHQAVDSMGRGINMGNTLEPPDEGDWAPAAQEYYFDDYKAAGFKTVRIPVRWYTHTAESSPYTIDEAWMNRVEEIVDWGLERGLYIIINAHHSEVIKEDYEGQVERYDSIWSQIAVRFKDKSERLFFEMINEPNGFTQDQINDYNARILSIIRGTNPTRIVIFGGHNWSNSDELITPNLVIPDDDYIMGYYHSYDPYLFGLEGQGSWGTNTQKNVMLAKFNSVAEWSDDNNIPVLLGEFGATSQGQDDINSRYRYYAQVVENCIVKNFAFAVWDDHGQFRIYNRNDRSWNDIKDIMIHFYPNSPTNLLTDTTGGNMVTLSWENRVDNNDHIIIQRKTLGEEYMDIDTIVQSDSTYSDTTVESGTPYHYRVIAEYIDSLALYSYPQQVYFVSMDRESFHGTPSVIPGTIEAEEFDIGAESVTHHDVDFENEGGAFRTDVGVDIEERSDGGFHVGWTEPGEWLEYTVNVEKDTSYRVDAHVASEMSGSFSIKIGDQTTEEISVSSTGSWEDTEIVSAYLNLPAGEQVMRVEIVSSPFNIDKFVFEYDTAVSTGIDHRMLFEPITVYPNPVHDQLNFDGNERNTNTSVLEIYDIHGRMVHRSTIRPYQSGLRVGHLKSGIYLIKWIKHDGVGIGRFIKE